MINPMSYYRAPIRFVVYWRNSRFIEATLLPESGGFSILKTVEMASGGELVCSTANSQWESIETGQRELAKRNQREPTNGNWPTRANGPEFVESQKNQQRRIKQKTDLRSSK